MHLINLLPYEPTITVSDSALKKRILYLSSLCIREIIEAIQDFYIERNLLKFDPHVGENLCQIRACQLIDIYYQTESNFNYSNELENYITIQKNLSELLKDEPESIKKHFILSDFLESLGLNFFISDTLHFLMLSHFLTKFRKFDEFENTTINYPKLINYLSMSKHFARRLIHQYQKQLSENSFKYITVRAELSNYDGKLLLPLLHQQDDDGRHTLPCYVVMSILLLRLKKIKSNILLVIRNEHNFNEKLQTLLFVFDPLSQKYIYEEKITLSKSLEPCVVFHCISNFTESLFSENYINHFRKINLEIIIMASMAAHPQFSGKKLTELKQNPFAFLKKLKNGSVLKTINKIEKNFLLLKSLALELRCSATDYSLLHIRHIFCDFLYNQMSYAFDNNFYSIYDELFLEKSNNPNYNYEYTG